MASNRRTTRATATRKTQVKGQHVVANFWHGFTGCFATTIGRQEAKHVARPMSRTEKLLQKGGKQPFKKPENIRKILGELKTMERTMVKRQKTLKHSLRNAQSEKELAQGRLKLAKHKIQLKQLYHDMFMYHRTLANSKKNF